MQIKQSRACMYLRYHADFMTRSCTSVRHCTYCRLFISGTQNKYMHLYDSSMNFHYIIGEIEQVHATPRAPFDTGLSGSKRLTARHRDQKVAHRCVTFVHPSFQTLHFLQTMPDLPDYNHTFSGCCWQGRQDICIGTTSHFQYVR